MCEWIRMKDGTTAIVCGGRHRKHKCRVCGRRATLQCDYPTDKDKTCDAWLCRVHAVPMGRNVDWCTTHEQPQGAMAL